MDEWICPACSRDPHPTVRDTNEDTDADGRRGRMLRTVECRYCGHEESF